MYKLARPLFFMCETSLHAGSGNDLGIVDLPIQRERHTSFPKIEGSGIKGSIREIFGEMKEIRVADRTISDEKDIKKTLSLVFGPENGDKHAGALGFTDARLLLFPVKSMKGVFAWVTCPRVLERLKKDLSFCEKALEFGIPPKSSTPGKSSLFLKDNKAVLEEYSFYIENKDNESCTALAQWLSRFVVPSGETHRYWRDKMARDIMVLPDDDFKDFVNLSTEVITRTKISNETGTVAKGQLFTEEYLPPETVLYTLILTTPLFSDEKGVFHKENCREETLVMDFLTDNLPGVVQIGGNATIGKGLIWTRVLA